MMLGKLGQMNICTFSLSLMTLLANRKSPTTVAKPPSTKRLLLIFRMKLFKVVFRVRWRRSGRILKLFWTREVLKIRFLRFKALFEEASTEISH